MPFQLRKCDVVPFDTKINWNGKLGHRGGKKWEQSLYYVGQNSLQVANFTCHGDRWSEKERESNSRASVELKFLLVGSRDEGTAWLNCSGEGWGESAEKEGIPIMSAEKMGTASHAHPMTMAPKIQIQVGGVCCRMHVVSEEHYQHLPNLCKDNVFRVQTSSLSPLYSNNFVTKNTVSTYLTFARIRLDSNACISCLLQPFFFVSKLSSMWRRRIRRSRSSVCIASKVDACSVWVSASVSHPARRSCCCR